MKGLRKYMPPFAPDISGATSVFYEMGGIIVICDAGGCSGNVCGFDEPRWFRKKSCIFSAGLRDMDAIFGRDDRLVAKLADACGQIEASCAVIIGTPVPAVIGTDYRALKRMAEKKTDLPVVCVEATGTHNCDKGEEAAWYELVKEFAADSEKEDAVGILGATPLSVSNLGFKARMEECFGKVYCYGLGDGLDAVRKMGGVSRLVVVSPAAVKAAEYVRDKFGIPCECIFPGADRLLQETAPDMDFRGRKVLIIHQQILANELRKLVREKGAAEVTCGSFFMMRNELKEEGDLSLSEEEDLIHASAGYDIVIGDMMMKPMVPESAEFIDIMHFACSGRIAED
ncbi:MAG: nitrogenase molybdenum-iron protein [Parasporobacterium sp.]|nr:nitrogenase molybdenum-iron protein [Parasporobacterium sp.]